jgi:hypothetical protein
MPAQEPAQVSRLRRGHPVDGVPAAGEEHRDRQPRRPGRTRTPPPAPCPPAPQPAPPAPPCSRTPPWAHTTTGTPSARQLPAPAPSAATRSPGRSRPAAGPVAAQPPAVPPAASPLPCPDNSSSGRHSRQQQGGHGPKVQSPATAPIHVLQPAQALRAGPLPSSGASVTRPAVAIKSARPGLLAQPQNLRRRHLPDQPGMLMQPWNPCADQAPELLT